MRTGIEGPIALFPGAPMLAPLPTRDDSSSWRVFVARSADGPEQLWSSVTKTQNPVHGQRYLSRAVSVWSSPQDTHDTLTMDMRTLAPRHEVLFTGGRLSRFDYDGAHVHGVISDGTGADVTFDSSFTTPVFAFNQVGTIVAAIPYDRRTPMIVPLFSEVDRRVEFDTLQVVGGPHLGDGTVHVRFADAVITTDYVVDVRTRVIRRWQTTNRKSGATFSYRP